MRPVERRTLLRHMRTPLLSFAVLMALLAINVVLGASLPFGAVWLLELLVTACMVLIVLLVSMEVFHEPPLVRLFASLGFFWVCIMFGMTMVDYLSR